jgi:hypothetical protein
MSALSETLFVHAAPTRAMAQDVSRRRIVGLIFTFYWLLVLEGALRKWGLPQLEQVFFFIRVPVTLLLYWIAFRQRRWPRTSTPLLGFYFFAVAATILVALQLVAGGYGQRYILLAGYGWVNYFLYVPLAFLIAEQFRRDDLDRLTRHAAWLALASCPIVFLQFFSPADSVVNLGSGLDEANQFKNLSAALGFVRPTGFFTSDLGQSNFVASTGALLLAAFLQRRSKPSSSPMLLRAGLIAVTLMVLFSQSRGLFLMLSLILGATAVGGLLAGRRRMLVRSAVVPALLIGPAAILWPVLFPTAFEVFMTRWSGAQESELQVFQFGVFGRAFYGFYGFLFYLSDTPIAGYLLGLGGNAASQLDWVQFPAAAYNWQGYGAWAEDGWSRHVIELGPLVGASFIGFRALLTVWLARKAVGAARRTGNTTALIVFGFVGVNLLQGQITGHGTVNGFTLIFIGVCLAAARISREEHLYTSPETTQHRIQGRA